MRSAGRSRRVSVLVMSIVFLMCGCSQKETDTQQSGENAAAANPKDKSAPRPDAQQDGPPLTLDFPQLAADLKDKGFDAVLSDLRKESASRQERQLAAAIVAARSVAEADPDQLWFQMQSRTRLQGWENLQDQLLEQQPLESLRALTCSQEPADPVVESVWRVATSAITLLAQSTDGSQYYFGGRLGDWMVVDATTGAVVDQRQLPGPVLAYAQGPDGDVVLSMKSLSSSALVQVSDIASGDLIAEPAVYTPEYHLGDCFLTPGLIVHQGRLICDGSRQQVIAVPLTGEPSEIVRFDKLPESFHRLLLITPDGNERNLIAVDNYGKVWRYQPETGRLMGEPGLMKMAIQSAVVNRDRTRIFGAAGAIQNGGSQRTGGISIYDTERGAVIGRYQVKQRMLATAILDDDATIALGSLSGSVSLFSVDALEASSESQPAGAATGRGPVQYPLAQPKQVVKVSDSAVTRLLSVPNRRQILVGSRNGVVKLVNLEVDQQPPSPLEPMWTAVRRSVSADGLWEADYSKNTVNIRDSATAKMVHKVQVQGGQVRELGDIRSVALIPAEQKAVLGGTHAVGHYDLKTKKPEIVAIDTSWKLQEKDRGELFGPFISPNGKYAVAASRYSVAIYDATSGERLSLVTPGVRNFSKTHCFLPNNRFAIQYQALVDKVRLNGIRVFDLTNGQEVLNLVHGAEVQSLVYARETGVMVTLGKQKHGDESRVFATWRPDSDAPEITAAPETIDRLIGMTDDGQRLLAVNVDDEAPSVVSVFDWSSQQVVRRFALDLDAFEKPQFDGRTYTLITRDRKRHKFQFIQAP